MGRFEQTPFHFVAYHGLSDIAYFMLEEPDGAVKDYLSENGRSITPLHIASRNGNPEIIRSLQRKIDFEFRKMARGQFRRSCKIWTFRLC